MARLDDLISFAASYRPLSSDISGYGVTGGWSAEELRVLVRRFVPRLRFHPGEHFYPASVNRFLFDWRSADDVESAKLYGNQPSDQAETETTGEPVQRLEDMDLLDEEVHKEAFATVVGWSGIDDLFPEVLHSADYDRAQQLFGSTEAVNTGGPPPTFLRPRYPIAVYAEFKVLKDALRYNLMEALDPETADLQNAVRQDPVYGTDIEGRRILLALLDSVGTDQEGIMFREAMEQGIIVEDISFFVLPSSVLTRSRWHVIRNYSLLVYHLFYPFNDWYQRGGVNDHEGDWEAIGMFFNNSTILTIPAGERIASLDSETLVPEVVIASAHKDGDGLDDLKWWSDLSPDEQSNGVKAWVALGSHATYLSEDDHLTYDLPYPPGPVDGATGGVGTAAACGAICGVGCFLGCLVVALLLIKAEQKLTDNTSNGGLEAGGPEDESGGVSGVGFQVDLIPHSEDSNLFLERDLLAWRSFPGRWGARLPGLLNTDYNPFTWHRHGSGPHSYGKFNRFIARFAQFVPSIG